MKAIIGESPRHFRMLDLCESCELDDKEKEVIREKVNKYLNDETEGWFAMRLRPRVKYQDVVDRFALINNEFQMPELFYPCEEITRRIGRKIVWEGKPVIRDIVFFKEKKSKIYPLFTKLYDLAWCYRSPGGTPGNYAMIPEKAMENFKESIGFLTEDFEIAPAGEMELKPGDEVVILDAQYQDRHGLILKNAQLDENGNKIYRVSLIDSNGHWDIGIDARLLKKY